MSDIILIGSRALQLRAPQILNRKCVDFDFICTMDEYDEWMKDNSHKLNPTKIYPIMDGKKMIVEGSTNCEFEIIKPGSSAEMIRDIVKNDPATIHTTFGMIPSFDMLFTIKASHKYLKNSPHFWKTLSDYHRMKHVGAKIRPEYEEMFKLREKETYNYAHPKLNTDKKSFFADDNISYVFDHDSIHQAVKLQDQPAYTYYIKDGEQVQCSKKKFFEADEAIRLAGVMEEAATLAVERSLVPFPGVMTPGKAWHFALMKVCSSITSGWFREYAYENAFVVMDLYPSYKYWERFQIGLNNGTVKPFTGSNY